MANYLSPLQRILKINGGSTFYIRHAAGLIYQYDVVNTNPVFIADLRTQPGYTSATLRAGFAIKGQDVYGCVGNTIFKNNVAIGTSLILNVISVFATEADDFIYVFGWGEVGGYSFHFEKWNIVTNQIDQSILWENPWGALVPPKKSNNAIIAYFMGTTMPSGGQRIASNNGAIINDQAFASGDSSDYQCASADLLVSVTWTGSAWAFNYINESGVIIGTIEPPVLDIIPLLDGNTYKLAATATTDQHFIAFTAVNLSWTFYNVYEITVTRDQSGVPNGVTLGSKVLTKQTNIYNEFNFSLGHIHSQTA